MPASAITITPDAVSGPPVSITPDAAPVAPQKEFMDRLNSRIAGNIRSIQEPMQTIQQFADEIKRRSAQPYVPGEGLKEIGESLKQTYSDPANVVGDIFTAGVLHSIGGGEEGAVERHATPEAVEAAPKAQGVSAKISDLLQDRIQKAATRFLVKRIPGAHLAMDVKDVWDALRTEPEAPKPAAAPPGPTGPPEQWGKQIPAPPAPAPAGYPPEAEPPAPKIPEKAKLPIPGVNVPPSIERIQDFAHPDNIKGYVKLMDLAAERQASGLTGNSLGYQRAASAIRELPSDQPFTSMTSDELADIKGIGPKTLPILEQLKEDMGKAFPKSQAVNAAGVPRGTVPPAEADLLDPLQRMLKQVKAGKKLRDLQ